MSELKCAFKHAIGDIVFAKTALVNYRLGLATPWALCIVQQMATRCCGGTQLAYSVNNAGDDILVHEDLLVDRETAEREIAEIKAAVKESLKWDFRRPAEKGDK